MPLTAFLGVRLLFPSGPPPFFLLPPHSSLQHTKGPRWSPPLQAPPDHFFALLPLFLSERRLTRIYHWLSLLCPPHFSFSFSSVPKSSPFLLSNPFREPPPLAPPFLFFFFFSAPLSFNHYLFPLEEQNPQLTCFSFFPFQAFFFSQLPPGYINLSFHCVPPTPPLFFLPFFLSQNPPQRGSVGPSFYPSVVFPRAGNPLVFFSGRPPFQPQMGIFGHGKGAFFPTFIFPSVTIELYAFLKITPPPPPQPWDPESFLEFSPHLFPFAPQLRPLVKCCCLGVRRRVPLVFFFLIFPHPTGL